MKIVPMEAIPANSNPFLHDAYNMGTYLGKNAVVMYPKNEKENQPYLIIVNTTTGERTKIVFDEAETEKQNFIGNLVDKLERR